MDLPQSVWDFSTPSMEDVNLPSLSEPEVNEVHTALHFLDIPAVLTSFEDTFDSVSPEALQWHSKTTTEEGSPLQLGRRTVSLEQKQASNREHQRRFRMRSKARSRAIEEQLAKANAELEELKSRHQQLETMLERASSSQEGLALHPSHPETSFFDQHQRQCKDIDLSPLLSVSIQGRTAHLTADEVRLMPVQQFSALWTAYVHELAQCLVVQLDDEKATSGLMKERMLILSVEGMRLIGRRLLQNPAAHKALITGNMAQGQRTLLHLDAGFYAHLMGLLDLTQDQISDLMHLRHLYLTKRGLLALERKELVSSIASFDNQLLHPSDYAATAADVADRLKESAFADQQVLYRIARAVWCGTLSTKQLCLVMVHAYPYMPILEPFLDTLAANEGFPDNRDVVALAQSDDMAAEWKDFDAYAMYIHTNMFRPERSPYIPLKRYVAARSGDKASEIAVQDIFPAAKQYVLT